jgi:hypothetical protein
MAVSHLPHRAGVAPKRSISPTSQRKSSSSSTHTVALHAGESIARVVSAALIHALAHTYTHTTEACVDKRALTARSTRRPPAIIHAIIIIDHRTSAAAVKCSTACPRLALLVRARPPTGEDAPHHHRRTRPPLAAARRMRPALGRKTNTSSTPGSHPVPTPPRRFHLRRRGASICAAAAPRARARAVALTAG